MQIKEVPDFYLAIETAAQSTQPADADWKSNLTRVVEDCLDSCDVNRRALWDVCF